jgi:heme-degrading monooxygenase HmoA
MHTRMVQCNVQKQRVNDLRKTLTEEVHPILRKQAGFVDVLETLDADSGQFVCMTLWRTKEDADRFGNSDFNKVAEKLTPLMDGQPTVRSMSVENSTAHQIRAGKAAA